MLAPTKHTSIKYSVIYVSGVILKLLRDNNIMKFDELKQLLINNLGIEAKPRLIISLTFLYSIGEIEYLKEIDAIIVTNE